MDYQHHFHAGNFADVVKHILLVALLDALGKKEKPMAYIDTHAGAGWYDLAAAPAQRSGEYLQGIAKLQQLAPATLADAPSAVLRYLAFIDQLADQTRLKRNYPGSPWLAMQLLRPEDVAIVMESEESIFAQLYSRIRDDRFSLHQRDAYEGLPALIPPPHKRGLVLIDPPYEQERRDFPELVNWIAASVKKWPQAVYALWYPIKHRDYIELFEKRMVKTGIRKQLICELCIWPDDIPVGLNGCGLLIINPPWQFADEAERILNWILPYLAQHETGAKSTVRWLVGE